MKLTHVRIQQILGLSDYEFKVGAITEISGRNGSGKSSIIKAIQAALGGGHDATLLRNGQEEGEIVLVFGDELEAVKKIKSSGSTLHVSPRPAGQGSQTYMNSMVDSFGINPVDILAEPKNRTALILESMRLRIKKESLEEAVLYEGKPLAIIRDGVEHSDALAVIEEVRKAVYTSRTDTNKDAKAAEVRITELKRSLPEDETADAAGLEAWIEEYDAEEVKLQERLRQIQAKRQECRDRLRRLSLDDNTRSMIAREEERHTKALAKSKAESEALQRLEQLKIGVAGKMPFGLEIAEDGTLMQKGIAFDKLNTQAQIALAMQLAMRRAHGKAIPLICVDGMERLDTEQYGAMIEWAKLNTRKAHFILTRVADTDLTVREVDADEERGTSLFESP